MVRSGLDYYHEAQVDGVEAALVQMERNGFKLDIPYLESALKQAREDEVGVVSGLRTWLESVNYEPDVNFSSPKQLVHLLHNHLGLPPSPVWKKGRVKLDDGQRKLDETALDWIRARANVGIRTGIDALIRLRRVRGAIKYLAKLPAFVASDGYVHPVCGPASDDDSRAGTITWRLASKNPEVQQIPNDPKKDPYRIRRAFVAPPGHKLIVADMTALEVVILAHLFLCLFDDGQLADLVAPGADDIHCVNARRVFGDLLGWERHGRKVSEYSYADFKNPELPELVQLRQDIKAVWYGLMYGKSVYGFATSLRDAFGNPIGEAKAKAIVDALYAALPALPRYVAYILEYVTRCHGIPGLGGAWCDLSYLTKTGNRWDLAHACRIAQNYPMQEGGARIIGRAIVAIRADRDLSTRGVCLERQIHDELDFRCPTAKLVGVEPILRRHMIEYPLRALLQVKIGVGDNWEDAKAA